MELSKWERKFITKYIRKKRKLSFKTRTIIWGVVSNVCVLTMLVFCWIEKTEYLFLIISVFIISFSLCSTNSLCNIIKKYDDKFI